MAEEIEDLDSTTQDEELETEEVTDDDDLDTLKEKLDKVQGANKQLYERTKKAEGFVKGEDGKWTKKLAEPKPKDQPAVSGKNYLQEIEERFEKRDLDELETSDGLKSEIRAYAKLNNVSIKQAFKSDYIQFKLDKEAKNSTAEEASLGGGGRRPSAKKNFEDIDPLKFDLATEEGKKDFAEWQSEVKKRIG